MQRVGVVCRRLRTSSCQIVPRARYYAMIPLGEPVHRYAHSSLQQKRIDDGQTQEGAEHGPQINDQVTLYVKVRPSNINDQLCPLCSLQLICCRDS
jgi:hypothetical protein